MKPEISVIVMAYNLERYVKLAIDSIYEQTFPGKILLIIADDWLYQRNHKNHRRGNPARTVLL